MSGFVLDIGFDDSALRPKAVRVEQGAGGGVFVHVVLETPGQVRAWAARRGVKARTGEPMQLAAAGHWYRHTRAVERSALGLKVTVAACECAATLEQLPQLTWAVTA